MDGMDRRIKVEEGAAPALAPAPASVMAGSDGHGAVAGKSDKTKAKNIVTPTSAAPTSPANGYAAAIPRVKKRKIDEDAAWTPAHVTSWVVGGDTDTANVKEKKSSVGATSNPVAARARNAEDADDIAIVKERKLDIRTVAAPVAPMARSAAPAPDAAKDNRLVIPGGTMMPRKQKREHGDADKLAKKKKTLSLKDKIADLRPEDPSWTDYMVRKPKEAHPGRSDGSKVAATGQKKKADGQRKGGSQAVADGRKTVDGGRQDCGRPADAAKKTVKQEPEPVISIETGSGGFGAGFASSFESSHNAGAATVMAPMYNDGYYGNVGFDGQTDGSFSASTNPDDGGFFQAALEGFVAGHGYPLDQFDGQQPGFSNEQMGLAHPCNDFNGQQGLSNEHAGQNYPLNHFNPGYPSNDYIGVGYPQHGGHPQYTGYPDWSQPAYGPAGYGYGAAGYGFGLIG